MSLLAIAALITAVTGFDGPLPRHGVVLAQSTNPALAPPERFGRSYAPPEQGYPGGPTSGPLLKTPPYSPRTPEPEAFGTRNATPKSYPTAVDCAADYSPNSGLTRKEFNRLCGKGS